MATLRIGVLGAARITPPALVKPARLVDGVEIVAVAARDRARAESFAAKHGIPEVLDTYDDVVRAADVDAIYNPLPNGLHGVWTRRALEAGKHVLCEKPFTANAEEAERVAATAATTGLVVMEAFHYRYHPVARRMVELVASGRLGEVRHIDTSMCIPLPLPKDIRYRLELAGGATMDTGCYAIHMNRLLAGAEPEVTSAAARLAEPGVDRWMRAELAYPGGVTGRMTCRAVVLDAAEGRTARRGHRRRAARVQPHRAADGIPHDGARRGRQGADPGRGREAHDLHVPARGLP